jgi:hypothetical protein
MAHYGEYGWACAAWGVAIRFTPAVLIPSDKSFNGI